MSDDASCELRLVSGPASEPVTLAQAKTFLRVEHTGDDDAITRAIVTARQFAESYLRMALLPQVWDYTVANPCGVRIRLPFGPAQSITSVTLVNEAGASSTMNAANYRLSVDGYAVLFTNAPSIENLTVRFSASSAATVSEVPAQITQGILHHIASMMENREGAVPLPTQALACYQPYRRVSL